MKVIVWEVWIVFIWFSMGRWRLLMNTVIKKFYSIKGAEFLDLLSGY